MIVELNRRLVKGYTHYKDDPRIVHCKQAVLQYNKELRLLGLRDHQVEYAKFSIFKVVTTLIYRTFKLVIMAAGAFPGLVLFGPVFVASKVMSIKKAREALAASTVKVQARDVIATWKLLVALAFAPILYTFYIALFTYLTRRNRFWGYVPESFPAWSFIPIGVVLFPTITFAALRFGEVGMDIFKSLRPLMLSLNPTSANSLYNLRKKREAVAAEVTELINTLGPEMFPDFNSARIVSDPFQNGDRIDYDTPPNLSRRNSEYSNPSSPVDPRGASLGGASSAQGDLPRNESFGNLGNVGLFATRPPSRNRSRSSSSGGELGSAGFSLKGFSTLDSKEGFHSVSQKIRGAMQERGKERTRRRSGASGATEGSWEMEDGEVEGDDAKKTL
jgi:glycerol-3-phosphate O-acyltransferase / dihydroxyacetone phosphate acyltransferase